VPIDDTVDLPSADPSPEGFAIESELAEAIWAEVNKLTPKIPATRNYVDVGSGVALPKRRSYNHRKS